MNTRQKLYHAAFLYIPNCNPQLIFSFAAIINHGISKMPCCVRDAASSVLSQHLLKWGLNSRKPHVRLRPRCVRRVRLRPAQAGSKLRCTRHGGDFFLIDTPLVLGYTIKITADNRRKIWPQIFAWSSAQGWM